MRRYCFQLQLRPERMAEYREHHAAVWPEMLRALTETGWRNYSIFVSDSGLLIGYLEADKPLSDLRAAMAATEVNAKWQAAMAPYFADLGDNPDATPDTGFLELTEVFNLEDQLTQLDNTRK